MIFSCSTLHDVLLPGVHAHLRYQIPYGIIYSTEKITKSATKNSSRSLLRTIPSISPKFFWSSSFTRTVFSCPSCEVARAYQKSTLEWGWCGKTWQRVTYHYSWEESNPIPILQTAPLGMILATFLLFRLSLLNLSILRGYSAHGIWRCPFRVLRATVVCTFKFNPSKKRDVSDQWR